MTKKSISRRSFVKHSFATASLIGLSACGGISGVRKPGERYRSPSGKLNIAVIGAGGRGAWDLYDMAGETDNFNVVGLCDLDENYMRNKINQVCPDFIDRPYYNDYRKMFDKIDKEIDAVIISTPDHSHAVITMDCMKRGKHVYTQKPLTHNIYETRRLKEAAREHKIVSSMGNQVHGSGIMHMSVNALKSGILGKISEVHVWAEAPCWSFRPRPVDTPKCPDGFNWDMWLGPAKYRPYHPYYHPFHWRGFWDFGTGALGDWGCHLLDQPVWALDLKDPVSVEAVSSNTGWWNTSDDYSGATPGSSIIKWKFPANENRGPVNLFWYDGGMKPMRPKELESKRKLSDMGIMYITEHGPAICSWLSMPRLLPETKMKEFKYETTRVPDVKGHYAEWVDACTGNGPMPHAGFDYSSQLTENVLLGCLAIRAGVGMEYLWDAKNMKVTNCPDADVLIKEPYREGWVL